MNIDEGYIKFKCIWDQGDFDFPDLLLQSLSQWRSKLYALNLVGAYDNGIGFGNISGRTQAQRFIITGSATGGKPELTQADYALVTRYRIDQNQVESTGQTKASSETMTHAALYESSPDIQARHPHPPSRSLGINSKTRFPPPMKTLPLALPTWPARSSGSITRATCPKPRFWSWAVTPKASFPLAKISMKREMSYCVSILSCNTNGI